MCLFVKDNSEVEKSEKVVKVYKRLRAGKLRFYSPYQDTRYMLGEVKAVKAFTGENDEGKGRFTDKLPDGAWSVEKGLHAYASLRAAEEWRFDNEILVECTIPRRTVFIRGLSNEIVSLTLKIGKAVAGPKHLMDRFNRARFTAKS